MVPEVMNRAAPLTTDISKKIDTCSGTTGAPKMLRSEIFSGRFTMVDTVCGRQQQHSTSSSHVSGLRVVVKVHRTTSEHFAVVFPDKLACKPIGFINLKNCNVLECGSTTTTTTPIGNKNTRKDYGVGSGVLSGNRTLQIVQKSCDGDKLTFYADSALDAKRCAEAMRSSRLQQLQQTVGSLSSSPPSPSCCRIREDYLTNSSLPNILEEGDEE